MAFPVMQFLLQQRDVSLKLALLVSDSKVGTVKAANLNVKDKSSK